MAHPPRAPAGISPTWTRVSQSVRFRPNLDGDVDPACLRRYESRFRVAPRAPNEVSVGSRRRSGLRPECRIGGQVRVATFRAIPQGKQPTTYAHRRGSVAQSRSIRLRWSYLDRLHPRL